MPNYPPLQGGEVSFIQHPANVPDGYIFLTPISAICHIGRNTELLDEERGSVDIIVPSYTRGETLTEKR